MGGLLALAVLSLASGHPQDDSKLNWNPPRVREITGGNGGHFFKVRIEQARFKGRGRKFSGLIDPGFDGGWPAADGRKLWGTDGWTKEELDRISTAYFEERATEIVSFEGWVDGKKLSISRKLFDDLLWPNLNPECCWAWLSKDGSRLVVKMLGSDASGSYVVIWTLRPNGKHSRVVEHGDC
jgi:hypothetical protein